MPRKAKPVTITDDDYAALKRMESSEDLSTSLRAKIILLSVQHPEKQDKEIADDLNTTPQTVLKWKTAYRTDGIHGLAVSKRGRRSVTPDGEEDLGVKIQELLDTYPEKNWTAQELATNLGVSQDRVFSFLRKQGMTLERKRCWKCSTREDSPWESEAFIGLYLSSTDQVFLIGDALSSLSGCTLCGAMETRIRGLFEEANRSVVPLTLLDTLVHATEYPEKSRLGRGETVSKFVSDLIRKWGNGRTSRLHIFIHGDVLCRDIPDFDVVFHRMETFDSLESALLKWSFKTLGPDGITYMARVLSSTSEYLSICGEDSEPYVWKLSHEESKSDTTSSSTSDIPIVESYASIEDTLHGLFPKEGEDTPTEMNKAILVHRSKDGTVEYRVIDQSYAKPIEGDLQSREGFDKLITSLDDVMTLFARDIDIAGRDFFMGLVKKNKDL